VTDAVLSGEWTPEEGSAAARVLEAHQKMICTVDIERQIRALEEQDVAAGRRPNRERAK
jgi:hypothetical protein